MHESGSRSVKKEDKTGMTKHSVSTARCWGKNETESARNAPAVRAFRCEVLPARTRKQPWCLAWHFRWEVELRWLEMGCDRIVKQVERVGQAQVQSYETALTAAPAWPMTRQGDTSTARFSGRANPRAGSVEQECIAFSSRRACLHEKVCTSWLNSV